MWRKVEFCLSLFVAVRKNFLLLRARGPGNAQTIRECKESVLARFEGVERQR